MPCTYQEIGGGKTYAQLSEAAMNLPKGSAAYTAAEAKVQTVFQGTTLRGLLLKLTASRCSPRSLSSVPSAAFVLAALMAVLVVFGFLHARRTPEKEQIFSSKTEVKEPALV